MNLANNGKQRRLGDRELGAIYDDAGTPPRDEWLKRSKERRREQRQERFHRIDAWLLEFRRKSPVLFALFAIGIGMCFAGVLLKVVELTAPR